MSVCLYANRPRADSLSIVLPSPLFERRRFSQPSRISDPHVFFPSPSLAERIVPRLVARKLMRLWESDTTLVAMFTVDVLGFLHVSIFSILILPLVHLFL